MFYILLGFALLASAFTANKFILKEINPIFFVALRMTLSGLILIGYYLKKRSPHLRIKHLLKDSKTILVICFCTTFIPSVLKAYALKYLISSEAVLIGSLDPFITAIYAYFLFSERITLRKFFGILIGFVSIILLLSSKHPILDEAIRYKIFSLPVLAAIGAVIVGRYGWILTQKLLQKHRYQPAEINGISMLGAGIFAFATAFFTGDIVSINSILNLKMMGLFSYTVIIGNIIAYTMVAYALKHNPVTLVSVLGFSVPIFSHFYGWLFLHEPLSWKFFIAVVCALIGFMIYKSPLRSEKPEKGAVL